MRLTILAFSAAATVLAQPPATNRVPTSEDFHGTTVREDYRWLEDADSEQTKRWVAEQNRYTASVLEKLPSRPHYRQRMAELFEFDRVPGLTFHDSSWAGYFERGAKAFYLKQSGLQNQPVLYVKDPKERVLLDPNTLSKDGTAALGSVSVSPDGRYLAYSIARAGSDWTDWRVREVATGKDLEERLEWSKFSDADWDPKSEGFYYGRFPKPETGNALQAVNENQRVYFHRVGTPQSADRLVYERPQFPRQSTSAQVTPDGRFLVLRVENGTAVEKLLLYRDLTQPDAKVTPIVDEFYADVEFLGSQGRTFYVLTNYEAPRYRVVAIDLDHPQRQAWRTVVAESKDTIHGAQLVGGELVVNYLHDVSGLVKIFPLKGGAGRDVSLPANSTVTLGLGSAKHFGVSSFLAPATVYECGAQGCRPMFGTKLPYDATRFESKQVFYESKDGTKIPMYLVYRKGLELNGTNRTMLYAYGGFNIPVTPGFSPFTIAWMERGGVYAVANLRGGSEYGEAWHSAGMKQSKQTVFDDFIAAGEWLVKNGYTSPKRLAIRGGSNGGLLVGAVLNQRPDLFGAAVPQVGVMDMLRFDRFTIGYAWASEYGSPKNAEDFKAIYKYSPLHNIREGVAYPATMVTTGDHDDRVVPAHSFKYAATLQRAQAGKAPVLIRIETAAGHGAGKPTSKVIDESADILSFLEEALR